MNYTSLCYCICLTTSLGLFLIGMHILNKRYQNMIAKLIEEQAQKEGALEIVEHRLGFLEEKMLSNIQNRLIALEEKMLAKKTTKK